MGTLSENCRSVLEQGDGPSNDQHLRPAESPSLMGMYSLSGRIFALCVKNTKSFSALGTLFFQNSSLYFSSEKTTMFSANIKYGLFCLPTVPVTPSSQGYFFSTVSRKKKKKDLLQVSKVY